MSSLLPDVRLSADVELEVGTDSDYAQHAARQAVIDRYAPRFRKVPIGITIPANGASFQFISDEPSPGRRIEIARLHLDVSTPIVASQSVAEPTTAIIYLVAAGDVSNVNQLSSAAVMKRYTTLPVDDGYGHRQMMVDSPENIYLVATNSGGTAIQLAGNIQLIDRPVDAWGDMKSVRELLNDWDLT